MNARKKVMDFLDKQGFYVVLAICLVVIAITALIAITQTSRDGMEELSQGNEELNQADLVNQNETTVTQEEETTVEQGSGAGDSLEILKPVEGEVITPFAGDNLIYNATLKQWTTHEAIDIAALIDTQVKSVMGGVVEDVYNHDLMGTTVVINHENGYKSIYSNLNEEVSVKKDDKVEEGAVLGKIGKTALSEYEMEAHLHFEFKKDDVLVNPMDYIVGLKVRGATE